jgi:carbonic anhydrase
MSADISRRDFVRKALIGTGIGIGVVSGLGKFGLASDAFSATNYSPASLSNSYRNPSNPEEALHRLIVGNERFASGHPLHPDQSPERRKDLVEGQHPWAAVLGCIDSRAPPELLFDLGLGEVFASRTAGQVLDRAVIGSLQYAVLKHVKLIAVIGHQNCGAVESTISSLENHTRPPGDLEFIVDQITPAVKSSMGKTGNLLKNSTIANVALEKEKLASTPIISEALSSHDLKIVGGFYDMESGVVNFEI